MGFLLPALGAAGSAIGSAASAAGPAILSALKGLGGAAVSGVKNIGLGGMITEAAKGLLDGNETSNEDTEKQKIFGGGNNAPIQPVAMPQFNKPPSAGALIAQMLQKQRGY